LHHFQAGEFHAVRRLDHALDVLFRQGFERFLRRLVHRAVRSLDLAITGKTAEALLAAPLVVPAPEAAVLVIGEFRRALSLTPSTT